MLKNKGPKTDPCGTPMMRCFHSLTDELIFVLCFFWLRKLEMSLRDLQQNPYASNNSSCCKQSNALGKTINKALHSPPLSKFSFNFSKKNNQ